MEGDITACFDEISHLSLMERVRHRVGDKRVLSLVKAFLKSGILSRDGAFTDTRTGTPQGGILSPLLANIALSVLDDYIAQGIGGSGNTSEDRRRRRRRGLPNYRLVRYADDFLVLVFGRREHAEALRDEVTEALKPMSLRLSVEKTKITHIDEGLNFLGWRIHRHRKLGTDRQYIYTYPARKSVRSATGKVKKLTGRQNVGLSLESLLQRCRQAADGFAEDDFGKGAAAVTPGQRGGVAPDVGGDRTGVPGEPESDLLVVADCERVGAGPRERIALTLGHRTNRAHDSRDRLIVRRQSHSLKT